MPRRLILSLAVALTAMTWGAYAADLKNPVAVQRWIADPGQIIPDHAQDRLQTKLQTLAERKGIHLVVVAMQDGGGQSAVQLAAEFRRQWKNGGNKELDAVLVATNDPAAIGWSIGKGLKEALPDATIQKVQADYVYPFLKQGQVSQGVEVLADELIVRLNDAFAEVEKPPETAEVSAAVVVAAIGAPVVFVTIFLLFKSRNKKHKGPSGRLCPTCRRPTQPRGLVTDLDDPIQALEFSLGNVQFQGAYCGKCRKTHLFAEPLRDMRCTKCRHHTCQEEREGNETIRVCRLESCGHQRVVLNGVTSRCESCSAAMDLQPSILSAQNMTEAQRIEQKLGNVQYRNWLCPSCGKQKQETAIIKPESQCSKCQNYTCQVSEKTLLPVTSREDGLKQLAKTCLIKACSHREVEKIPIPRHQNQPRKPAP